ncbi:hypothetical protein PN502_13680 [Microcystis aeruginosa CS-338/01]|nr:hypothetical protein [Microcystis aeruginosa]MDB9508098.1 hypothetical protein [Microcystis aeruginosa CS-338/01]
MTDINARMLAKLAFVVTQIKKNGIKLPFAFCLLPFAFPNQEVNFARLLT